MQIKRKERGLKMSKSINHDQIKIVGIAACPAGLAHTPMASKALEDEGKKQNIDIKIEQQGIMGQVNAITLQEAKNADLVLIISNQMLEGMDRFEGKPKVRINIGDAVKQPEVIVQKCIKKIESMRG